MTTRVVKTEADRSMLLAWLAHRALPFTVDVKSGKHRTVEQNRLQRLWCNEIAEQLGDRTAEEVRGYCKLHFGVPILREDDDFREKYDAVVRGLPYETKLLLMQEPFDFPVTRNMRVDQKSRYLDAIVRHFAEQGVRLTMPEEVG